MAEPIVSNYPGLDKRAEWGPGPWVDEPDRVEWHLHGYPCLARRAFNGAWCGYVGVPPSHPWWGVDREEIHAHTHKDITWTSESAPEGYDEVCHSDHSARWWWIGFDCAHACDIRPSDAALPFPFPRMPGAEYRPITYVMILVGNLAIQIDEVARAVAPRRGTAAARRAQWKRARAYHGRGCHGRRKQLGSVGRQVRETMGRANWLAAPRWWRRIVRRA